VFSLARLTASAAISGDRLFDTLPLVALRGREGSAFLAWKPIFFRACVYAPGQSWAASRSIRVGGPYIR